MLYLLLFPSNKIQTVHFWNIKHFFAKEVEGETFYCDSIICTNTKRQKYTGNIVFLLTGIHRDLVCYCFLKFICGSGPADYWKTYLQLHPLSSLSEKCSIRNENVPRYQSEKFFSSKKIACKSKCCLIYYYQSHFFMENEVDMNGDYYGQPYLKKNTKLTQNS